MSRGAAHDTVTSPVLDADASILVGELGTDPLAAVAARVIALGPYPEPVSVFVADTAMTKLVFTTSPYNVSEVVAVVRLPLRALAPLIE
jgi:hypothetical protein